MTDIAQKWTFQLKIIEPAENLNVLSKSLNYGLFIRWTFALNPHFIICDQSS